MSVKKRICVDFVMENLMVYTAESLRLLHYRTFQSVNAGFAPGRTSWSVLWLSCHQFVQWEPVYRYIVYNNYISCHHDHCGGTDHPKLVSQAGACQCQADSNTYSDWGHNGWLGYEHLRQLFNNHWYHQLLFMHICRQSSPRGSSHQSPWLKSQ